VNGDSALLARSRLPVLETALSGKLIPAKREIIGAATQADVRALAANVRNILDARMAGIAEQLDELTALRGKNLDVVVHMMDRIREEKDVFERGLARYTALRNVFTQQTNDLFDIIGLPALRGNATRTRRAYRGQLAHEGRARSNERFLRAEPRRFRACRRPVGGDPRNDARDVRALRERSRARAVPARRRSPCSNIERKSNASSAPTTPTSTRCGTW
jgi:hypothetical protein